MYIKYMHTHQMSALYLRRGGRVFLHVGGSALQGRNRWLGCMKWHDGRAVIGGWCVMS